MCTIHKGEAKFEGCEYVAVLTGKAHSMREESEMATLDLAPAANAVSKLLGSVTDDRLNDPTPCDISVGALLDHMMSLTQAFTWAAQKSGPDGKPGGDEPPPAPSAEQLDPQWRQELPR